MNFFLFITDTVFNKNKNMGNVIIVKGADYSASGLGKVTILPNDKEIIQQAVAAYYAAAGNVGNAGAINKMVTALVVNGLWNKVKVLYPILGTTLASQAVDLKGAQDLVPFVNATAGTDNIIFDNKIGIGDLDDSELTSNVSIDYSKRMVLLGMNYRQTNSYVLCGKTSTSMLHNYLSSHNRSGIGRVLRDYTIKNTEDGIYPVLGNYLTGFHYNTHDSNNQKLETYQNGVVNEYAFDTTKWYNIPSGTKAIYPNIGGAYDTGTTAGETLDNSDTNIASCNFWFYSEAEFATKAEAVLFDSICREFCASAGKPGA